MRWRSLGWASSRRQSRERGLYREAVSLIGGAKPLPQKPSPKIDGSRKAFPRITLVKGFTSGGCDAKPCYRVKRLLNTVIFPLGACFSLEEVASLLSNCPYDIELEE